MTMQNIILAAAMLGGLSGCSFLGGIVDDNLPAAASAVADALETYCAAPLDERKKLHAAVVENYARNGIVITVPVFDCDGDGNPDFMPQSP